jgi:hypothetical protein
MSTLVIQGPASIVQEQEPQEVNSLTKMYEISVESLTPIGYGRYYELEYPPLPAELKDKDAYERRTWMKRLWTNSDGFVFIPGPAFKLSMMNVCPYLSDKVPGTGNKGTYTKHFLSGFHVIGDIVTGYIEEDVIKNNWGKWLFVPANAQRGGTTRVMRCFPTIPKWNGVLKVVVHDPCLTKDVIQRVGNAAGLLIGVGSLRVQNGGQWGQFKISSVEEKPF